MSDPDLQAGASDEGTLPPGAAGPDGWETLARAAASGDTGEAPAILRELLVLEIGGTAYAIPVERVREIVRMRELTPMPRVPAAVRGILALRGEVIQVVDLGMRLGLSQVEQQRSTRIIVLHGEDDRLSAVLVDAVREVVRVDQDEMRPATGREDDSVLEIFLRNDEFVSVLSLDRVLELRGDL